MKNAFHLLWLAPTMAGVGYSFDEVATDAGVSGAFTAGVNGLVRVHWAWLLAVYAFTAMFAKPSRPILITCMAYALIGSGAVMLSAFAEPLMPSWVWYPTVWLGGFRVVEPSELGPALHGVCAVDRGTMCLREAEWNTLSGGGLSSYRAADVMGVDRGLSAAHYGGLVVGLLARDTEDAILPLRHNIEALRKFFPRLSVVIFENDSADRTRVWLEEWAAEAHGYTVDLMSCHKEGSYSCKLGKVDRWQERATDAPSQSAYYKPAVGLLPQLRNRLVDHILAAPRYRSYSHVLMMDVDLAISLAPLGVVHAVGLSARMNHTRAIASAGRNLMVGSFGTLEGMYDLAAFKPAAHKHDEGSATRAFYKAHQWLCHMEPDEARTQFACPSISAFNWMGIFYVEQQMTSHGRCGTEALNCEVTSAFNGASLYPLKLLREKREARYSGGPYGQTCEHIAWNEALGGMLVDSRWQLRVHPQRPPGPLGEKMLTSLIVVSANAPVFTVSFVFLYLGHVVVCLLAHLVMRGAGLSRTRRTTASYSTTSAEELGGKGVNSDATESPVVYQARMRLLLCCAALGWGENWRRWRRTYSYEVLTSPGEGSRLVDRSFDSKA